MCQRLANELVFLKSIYARERLFTEDLRYQKLYLTLKLSDFLASEKYTLNVLHDMGVDPNTSALSLTPKRKFKRCVYIVMSICRMKVLCRNYQQVLRGRGMGFRTKSHSEERLVPLLYSTIQKKEQVFSELRLEHEDEVHDLERLESQVREFQTQIAQMQHQQQQQSQFETSMSPARHQVQSQQPKRLQSPAKRIEPKVMVSRSLESSPIRPRPQHAIFTVGEPSDPVRKVVAQPKKISTQRPASAKTLSKNSSDHSLSPGSARPVTAHPRMQQSQKPFSGTRSLNTAQASDEGRGILNLDNISKVLSTYLENIGNRK